MDIFDYIYGVLFSPSYRKVYREFLITDFPRIPYPKAADSFWSIVEKGRRLRKLHLDGLDSWEPVHLSGSNLLVGAASHSETTILINRTARIDGVSQEAWDFTVGSYQILPRWFKEKKGEELSEDDLSVLGEIIGVIDETISIMHILSELTAEL